MRLLNAAIFHQRLLRNGYRSRLHYVGGEEQWHVVVPIPLSIHWAWGRTRELVDVHFYALAGERHARMVKIHDGSGRLRIVKLGGVTREQNEPVAAPVNERLTG